ncbi:hypothetical protein [Microbacterium sp.]|uniref:hypothetical protein n=1 Tax=Microbacterium sp. TaxID=51671 RepID=UPI002E2FEDC0|nr:hypothetical protein [Microbacterium sp.]HEX5730314.1 hypothetical protein [Microbacterium sp.]
MGHERPGDVTHGGFDELGALRRRAYGPGADIFADAEAVARLQELEERARMERYPHEVRSDPAPAPAPRPEPGTGMSGGLSVPVPRARPRTSRWHTGLVAATAVVALALGAAAGNGETTTGEVRSAYAKTPGVALERRALSYEAGYEQYLDGLREELLSGPGMGDIANRLIREQFRPYGTLYGRTVGAGPTVDHQFCMVVTDVPEPSITCISIENAYANPQSVLLSEWIVDSSSDAFLGLGEPVSYTLLPGGGVVAERAGSATTR